MQLTVNGQHINVGDALRTHVADKLEAINSKYFNRAIDVQVTFSKETESLYKTHISLRMGKDILVQATAKEHDPYLCFDSAADKIAKQLRRYKRRLRDHHERLEDSPELELVKARSYVLSELDAEPENETEEYIGSEPAVIAEIETAIQTLSVSEAVMRMDLEEQNAYMFRNRQHGGLNMIYRRQDGNIGWVDPQEAEKAEAAE
jgi:ribosomal subunit interface protein